VRVVGVIHAGGRQQQSDGGCFGEWRSRAVLVGGRWMVSGCRKLERLVEANLVATTGKLSDGGSAC
jgi:hypothetical protein